MPLLSYAWAALSFQQGTLAVLAVQSASIPAWRTCLSKHAACLSLLCSQLDQPLGVSNLPELPADMVPPTSCSFPLGAAFCKEYFDRS